MRAVVAASVITGLAAAAAGVIVSAGGTEPVVDGLVLLGFAVGWTLLLALDNSIHLVVAGATHQSLLDNPTHAATTSRAITAVVDAARTGTPQQ